MATKLYLRSTASDYDPTSGKKSSANPKYTAGANNASSTQQGYAMSTTQGGGTATISLNSDNTTATRTNFMGRWTSEPLAAQSIASGTWTIALHLNESNTNADSLFSCCVYLAAQGGSAIASTIYDSSTDLGAEWSSSGAGQVVTFSGSGVTATAGQVLVVEVFRNTDSDGQNMATAYAQILSFDGTSDVTAGGAGTGSYLSTPAAVNLSFAARSLAQDAFRFYADGTESGSTALQNQDTDHTADTSGGDVNLQVRVRVQESGGIGGVSTDDYQLYYAKNGGSYTLTGTRPTIDSYALSNGDGSYPVSGGATYKAVGQSFTGNGGILGRISLRMSKTSTPTGNATVGIFAHSGTFGSSSLPTGSALATSDNFDVSTLTGSAADYTINFSGANQITLTNAVNYVLVVSFSGGDASNYINVFRDVTSPSHAGNSFFREQSDLEFTNSSDIVFVLDSPGTVLGYNSSNLTDGNATTNRLTGGSGSFVAGKISEDGEVNDLAITYTNFTELLYSITITASQVADADTLDFRVYRNGSVIDSYSVTPRITIDAGAGTTMSAAAGSYSLTGNATALKKGSKLTADSGTYALTGNAAALKRGYPMTATAGSYSLTGNDVTFRRTYVMPVAAGSYALTGNDTGLKRGLLISATAGAYAITGNDVSLKHGRLLTATSGTYALTGFSVTLSYAPAVEGIVAGISTGPISGAAISGVPPISLPAYSITAEAGSYAVTGNAVTFTRTYKLAADSGTYELTGNAANLLRGYYLAAVSGTYAITGNDAVFRRGYSITAASGSYALTGNDVALPRTYKLTANNGSYAVTGNNTNLLYGRKVIATSGSYVLTGNAVGLSRNVPLIANAGTYALTGNATGLRHGRKVTAEAGSYTLTGNTVDFRKGFTMSTVAGSYALTGNSTNLLYGRRLTAVSGSYAVTGNTAGLYRGYKVTANSGTYLLTGNDVTFKRGLGMVADGGVYALTGNTVNLRYGRSLTANTGTYTITGNATGLLHGRKLTATSGAYTLTGNNIAFTRGLGMIATSGVYNLTGNAVNFARSYRLAANNGSYALNGNTANFLYGRKVVAASGSYVLSGNNTGLRHGRVLRADAGSYTLIGQTANLFHNYVLPIQTGTYALTGNNVTFAYTSEHVEFIMPYLLEVTSGQQRLYVSTGHGELAINSGHARLEVD